MKYGENQWKMTKIEVNSWAAGCMVTTLMKKAILKDLENSHKSWWNVISVEHVSAVSLRAEVYISWENKIFYKGFFEYFWENL